MARYVEATVTRENGEYFIAYNGKREKVQITEESQGSWASDSETRLFLFSAHFVAYISIYKDDNPENEFKTWLVIKANNKEINLLYRFRRFFQVD